MSAAGYIHSTNVKHMVGYSKQLLLYRIDTIEHTVYHYDKCKIKDRTKCLDALEIIPIHRYEMNAVVN